MIKILALVAAFIIAVTPVALVTHVDGENIAVNIHGNSYRFRGTNFHEGEHIRVVFFAEGVWEVLPW